MFTIAPTSEQVNKDRENFYSRYSDASGWQHFDWRISILEKERLSSTWERLINTQNGRDLDDYAMPPGINKVEKLFLPWLSGDKGRKILLLGVGTGREVALLRNLGFPNVQGVTLGPRNLRFAQEVVGLPADSLIWGDCHFLPLPAASYQAVGGFQILEHCLSPLLMLLECHRLLQTGGVLVLQSPASTAHTGDKDLHHILCPIPLQTRGLLLKAGFSHLHFYTEGNGLREVGYKEAPLSSLPTSWEERADVEYLVVGYKE